MRSPQLLLLPVALLATAAAAQRAAAPGPPPVIVSAEALKLPVMTAAAAAPGRVYLGRQYSYDPKRLNLAVVTVDAQGKVQGVPRRYADSDVPLPTRTQSTVTALLLDPARRKLYLTRTLTAAVSPNITRLLTVWDLDASGEPTGAPRSYECGNPNRSLISLARHPKLNVLYMVGWGGAGIYVYQLDAKGEPQGQPKEYPLGGQGKYEVALSPGGERMYLGTYPDTLEIVDLDAAGAPTGKPRAFPAGHEQQYLRFQYLPQALYLTRPTPAGPRLAVWPLSPAGDPFGTPTVQPELPVSALAADLPRRRLCVATESTFQDALTGKTIVDGVGAVVYAPRADGSLGDPLRRLPGEMRRAATALTVAPSGAPVLVTQSTPGGVLGNRVSDFRVRVTLLEAHPKTGAPPAAFPVTLDAYPKQAKLGGLTVGQPSAWVNLDPLLRDQMGPLVAALTVGGPVLDRLKARLEIAQGDKLLKTMTDEVQSGTLLCLLPGYGFEPPAARTAAIELLSEHARKYLAAARAVALKPQDRPRQFVISCYQLMGGQGHLRQLQDAAETVSSLGFNTVNAYAWPGIPPAKLDAVLDAHGLSRRSQAVYNPPSYFDFDQEKMNPAALDRWASDFAAQIGPTNGGTPGDVVDFKLADEPGWYYPTMLREVRNNPAWLERFRAYLREQGLRPAELDAADWSTIYPTGAAAARALPQRKLFYWTMRFFSDSASRGHLLATQALERAYKRPMSTVVNWNNFANRWYMASPNQKIANNPISDPDSAYGGFSWFQSGRLSAHTLWTEDWFGDQDAQTWSYYGDLLRSGAMLGKREFGGYVVGGVLGAHPEGGKYKILSLIGHGAKTVDLYTWGPELLFPGNCWSESLSVYRPIAEALGLVGRAERLLYPGRPARGKVALAMPGSSALWEADARVPYYLQEVTALHHALIHAGYTVDFVDEQDLADGALAARGYTTLYLTQPNVALKAQEAIRTWVRAGGTLAATPGAATADEYNTPTTVLDEVLGLRARKPVRDPAVFAGEWESQPESGAVTLSDPAFGTGVLPVKGPLLPLELNGARPVGTVNGGTAEITTHPFGNGTALAYGYYPGAQYWGSPDRSDRTHLPRDWSEALRLPAVAPARLAHTPTPVIVSTAGVEACRLESPKGIAVVLLNWTDRPLKSVKITIPGAGKFRKVTSVERGPVGGVLHRGAAAVELPLKSVDVLLLEP